ncbi:response regulator [Lachnospiraceae bacterium WCA-9-b2]|uniref:Stage 0 sporulation protein A homolog n=1 Tax=Sporofaciens musculi TaxID=2681861 RepID=A0A7X3MEL5_9FIRM|nr:LytTR family DNA-binding domain-containing protein [Sporofaciens musculi]MCI9421350.1 response regulator transcription factor [Dorea sp.]MXP75015.1 response regulator [Sporofaciens musculi]
MYRIAICDDDSGLRRFLRQTIEEEGPPCVVDEFSDGVNLLKSYNQWAASDVCVGASEERGFDILFLDIDMPRMNGIDTAKKIRTTDRRVKIIYVTGYQDYMGKSFEVHPFSFLVKPVKKEEIVRQIREALLYGKAEEKEIPLRLQTTEGVEEFRASDIYYLEYVSRKLRFVTKKGESMVRGKISEYLERLEAYGFASPHKSFAVNLYHVKAIRGYDIIMMNGERIPLSQKRSVEFRGLLGKYQADRL